MGLRRGDLANSEISNRNRPIELWRPVRHHRSNAMCVRCYDLGQYGWLECDMRRIVFALISVLSVGALDSVSAADIPAPV